MDVNPVEPTEALDTMTRRGGPMHISIDELLANARIGLARVEVGQLIYEMAAGALVIDLRPLEQRQRDGSLTGALVIDRNVLEWRLAPSSQSRLVDLDREQRVILVCNEGYSSSLAAASLQELGLPLATDLVGGFQALIAQSHPMISTEHAS
ncbi:MAG: rhodanese-like domain-containing protein [Acidimicrobiia bacterium]